jgi:hypothetical protein
MKSTILWDITPCSPFSVNRRFEKTSPPFSGSKYMLFPHWFHAGLIFSTLKMEAICSSETSIETHIILFSIFLFMAGIEPQVSGHNQLQAVILGLASGLFLWRSEGQWLWLLCEEEGSVNHCNAPNIGHRVVTNYRPCY